METLEISRFDRFMYTVSAVVLVVGFAVFALAFMAVIFVGGGMLLFG